MTVTAPAKVFADRIGRIEVSATMAVAAEAAKLRAQGANLVDFGAGEPHFPTPRHIKDAAIAAIDANFTRYTVVPGIPDVRKAIVDRIMECAAVPSGQYLPPGVYSYDPEIKPPPEKAFKGKGKGGRKKTE